MVAGVQRLGTVPGMTTTAPMPDFSENIEPTAATATHPYIAAALFLVQHLRTLDEVHAAALGVRRALALLSAEVLVTEDSGVGSAATSTRRTSAEPSARTDVRGSAAMMVSRRRAMATPAAVVWCRTAVTVLELSHSAVEPGSKPVPGGVRPLTAAFGSGETSPSCVSEGGLEPPPSIRGLAPQASASAYSATRTRVSRPSLSARVTVAKHGGYGRIGRSYREVTPSRRGARRTTGPVRGRSRPPGSASPTRCRRRRRRRA